MLQTQLLTVRHSSYGGSGRSSESESEFFHLKFVSQVLVWTSDLFIYGRVCLSVQVWELSSGELLLSVLFDVEIMSVTFDPCEYFLFCGGSDGNIFQVSLCSQVSLTLHFTSFI